jgi:hypothetical protein
VCVLKVQRKNGERDLSSFHGTLMGIRRLRGQIVAAMMVVVAVRESGKSRHWEFWNDCYSIVLFHRPRPQGGPSPLKHCRNSAKSLPSTLPSQS